MILKSFSSPPTPAGTNPSKGYKSYFPPDLQSPMAVDAISISHLTEKFRQRVLEILSLKNGMCPFFFIDIMKEILYKSNTVILRSVLPWEQQ
jgi:hypothetical protein